MAEKKLIDIELYEAASTQNDTAEADKFVTLLGSKGIPNQEIMSYKAPSRNTLLHIASLKGNLPVVKCILDRCKSGNIDISATNWNLETALHLAARSGRTEVVEKLLGLMKERKDTTMLTAKDERGNTAAHEAVLNGHHLTVKALMEYDPGVQSYSKNDVLKILNLEGESPLYIAVKEGKNVELVKSMLERLDLSEKDKYFMEAGKPLLYPAIMSKNKEMLDAILNKAKELINMRDAQGRKAIHYAASSGYDYGVDSLIVKDKSCVMQRDDEGVYPVHIATRNGQIEVLKKLLDKCLCMEELVTNKGRNILHEAAYYGKHGVVKYILNNPSLKSLVNQQDYEGNTPLHLATMKCQPEIVSIMTWDTRVDLKIVNYDRKTVVDVAVDKINENPTKFHTRLTLSALVSAGGTKAREDVIPTTPFGRSISFREDEIPTKPSGPSIRDPPFISYSEDVIPTKPSGPFLSSRGEMSRSNAGSGEQQVPQRSDSKGMKGYKDRANTLILVATLIATITFAAGFTIPGGYDVTTGVPILMHRTSFSVFTICNSVALYSSIMVVAALIWAQLDDLNLIASALTLALPLLVVALAMMSVAFMAGTYVFASPHGSIKFSWRGILALVMGGVFGLLLLLLILPLCLPLDFKNPILRHITYYTFRLLVWLASDRRSIEDSDAKTREIKKKKLVNLSS